MTEIRNTGETPRPLLSDPAQDRGGKERGGTGLGGSGAETGLSGGLQKDAKNRSPGGAPAQPSVQSFEASLLRAGVPPQGVGPAAGHPMQGKDGGEERMGRDPLELVVIPRGEGLPAARAVDAPTPGHAAKVEAMVDRILAEISAGQKAQLQHGVRGELTVSFPMTSAGLGLSAIALTLDARTLTVTLSLAGQGPDEAALRDLAQSLAQRHPSKTIRICREPGAERQQDREA